MTEQYQLEVFPWNENFATGISLVDEQHKQLVHLINKLASQLSLGWGTPRLNDVFQELVAYADLHFKTEEKIWAAAFQEDEWLSSHLRTHASFLQKAPKIEDEEEKGPRYEKSLAEILKYLVNWLVFHILDDDRRMAKVVLALDRGMALEPAKELANREMEGVMQTFVETVLMMYETLTSRSIELIKEKNHRAQVEEELLNHQIHKQSMDKLLHSLEKTIAALASMVELRSPYTAGHQRRVAILAEAIASEMGLPEDDVQGVLLAASVHDIGDIQVPAEILARPGKLTSIETQLVRQHAQAGYEILKEIDFPWPIAQMVLQHHERLDGSGYPNALKDEQIVLGAKIIAVADVVEAISTHRPYRGALGTDAALAEIISGRGIAFDPLVVDACITLFREKGFAFPL